MTTETFLPEGYKLSQSGGKYLKLKQGANKIRIISSSIVGWLDWKDKKPVRTIEKKAPLGDQNPREFRAFAVWSYSDECIMSAEFTQTGIKQAIIDLYTNDDRGDPKEYDITISRTGEGMETKYIVQPSPKKPLTPEQSEALLGVVIDMEQLFVNGEPIQEVNF